MTATAHRDETWQRVTRREPCPICRTGDWCKVSPDGMIAGCMREQDGAYKTVPTALGDMYLHRLTDEPRALPPPRPKPSETLQRDVVADRAVYALVVQACAPLPDFALAELVRRFGPTGPAIAARHRIGYCDGPTLLRALDAAGRRRDAIAAGVLRRDGTVARSLAGRLVIPYLRDGLVHDLRGAGIKGRGETKELSLSGSYAERDVADLFFHHEALGQLGPEATIHLAGGAYKTMALIAAGLPAVATRGEAEWSEGHAAALLAADVRTIVLHIDAEDPKEGQALSAGRRLGLAKAERLALAGFAVRVAEPPREPGTPKLDPDALLRDFGPGLVRAYALSAPSFAAWRVAIGVDVPGIPATVQAEIDALRHKCAKQQRMLTNYVRIRSNKAIKAERDTLAACAIDLLAEQANGHADAEGWVRQPASRVADTAGKSLQAVRTHLHRGEEWGLIERKLVEEFDRASGQRRTVYYVRAKEEPERILDVLVTLDPEREAKSWGGKREPCPRCQSLRRLTVVTCADCGLEFSRKVDEPDPEPETVADVSPREGAPPSVPLTPVAPAPSPAASYPADAVTYHRAPVADPDDEADDWDPYECNHPGCTARLDPALGKRYCWQHQRARPVSASAPPGTDPVLEALDAELVRDLARRTAPDIITARLAGLRARWDAGERSATVRIPLGDWEAIAAARAALDAGHAVAGEDR